MHECACTGGGATWLYGHVVPDCMCVGPCCLLPAWMYVRSCVSMSGKTNSCTASAMCWDLCMHLWASHAQRNPQRRGSWWWLEIFPGFRTTELFVMERTVIPPPACLFLAWDVRLAGQFARSLGWLEACMPSCSKVRDSAKALRISGMCALAVDPSSSILVAVVASARGGITPASS